MISLGSSPYWFCAILAPTLPQVNESVPPRFHMRRLLAPLDSRRDRPARRPGFRPPQPVHVRHDPRRSSIEGTVARFDWVNPHMYLIVETKGPDGKPALVEGEGLGITQALVDGLDREALKPGTPVVMRANPNRGGWGKQVRILDVTTQDGEIHPFYAANTRTRVLTPAESLEGHWAPSRAALGAAFGAMARWPVTPEGRAAQATASRRWALLCRAHTVPRGARRAAHDRDRRRRGRDAVR